MGTERLRVPVSALAEGRMDLDADASRYVLKVHRCRPGDVVVLFDPASAKQAEARIIEATRVATVQVDSVVASDKVATRPMMLIQALAKGAKLDAIVRDATELGVTAIVVVIAERSVKRSASSSQVHRWRRIALEAARQCGRGDVPGIEVVAGLPEALGAGSGEYEHRFCLHPAAPRSFGDALRDRETLGSAAVLIGPEGGWSEHELRVAEDKGFVHVSFGRFVLRTETACAAAFGALNVS